MAGIREHFGDHFGDRAGDGPCGDIRGETGAGVVADLGGSGWAVIVVDVGFGVTRSASVGIIGEIFENTAGIGRREPRRQVARRISRNQSRTVVSGNSVAAAMRRYPAPWAWLANTSQITGAA